MELDKKIKIGLGVAAFFAIFACCSYSIALIGIILKWVAG